MSSFVISKNEYMKAAGFCAALAEQKNYFREPVLRLWDPVKYHVAGDEDYKKYFNHLYKLNASSVAAQYNDGAPEADTDEYKTAFDAAKAATISAYIDAERGRTEALKRLVFGFYKFSQSVKYQIEEERAERLAHEFLNKVNEKLIQVIQNTLVNYHNDDNTEFWGAFPLK